MRGHTHTHTHTQTDTQTNCSENVTPPRFRGGVTMSVSFVQFTISRLIIVTTYSSSTEGKRCTINVTLQFQRIPAGYDMTPEPCPPPSTGVLFYLSSPESVPKIKGGVRQVGGQIGALGPRCQTYIIQQNNSVIPLQLCERFLIIN